MQDAKKTYQSLPKNNYEASWFFKYADGKIKKGIYNLAGSGADTAFSQSKNGVVSAGINARCGNRVERQILSCEGQDFCNFEWVAGKSLQTGKTSLIGLTLVTRYEKATFNLDGSVTVTPRDNKEDKFFHYGRA